MMSLFTASIGMEGQASTGIKREVGGVEEGADPLGHVQELPGHVTAALRII